MTLEQRLADEVSADLDGWVQAVLTTVAAELPDLVGDDTAAELATSSSRALLSEFAAALRLGDVATSYRAPIAALGFARHLARSSVPLAGLLRSYRLGQELLFERAADLAAPDEIDGVRRVGLLTFRFVDAVVGEVTEAFEREREAFLRGSLARRDRMLARLLDGAEVPTAEAERVLGRRMSGQHLALIAWSSEESDSEALASSLRAGGLPSRAALERLLPSGARLAFGEPGQDRAGFVGSRRHADAARRTARYVDSTIVAYRDIRLLHLLLADHAAALSFAHDELGELGADEHADLRRTLWVFLDSGRDSTATAARLGVHRNTVMRRLARATELLGSPSEERTAELLVALVILGAGKV